VIKIAEDIPIVKPEEVKEEESKIEISQTNIVTSFSGIDLSSTDVEPVSSTQLPSAVNQIIHTIEDEQKDNPSLTSDKPLPPGKKFKPGEDRAFILSFQQLYIDRFN
jgi:hypothetical protein